MAGEDQYINPIIQAMVHSAQLGQQRLETQERAKQFTQENKIRQQLADQANTELQNQSKYHQDVTENAHARLQLEEKESHLHALEVARQVIQGGTQPQDVQGSGSAAIAPSPGLPAGVPAQPQMQQVPGIEGLQFPKGTFPGPQQEAERIKLEAGAKARGEAEGRLPSEQALAATNHANKLLENEANLNNALKLHAQEGAEQEKIANIHGGYQLAASNVAGKYHLLGIEKMHSLGLDGLGEDSGGAINTVNNAIDGILDGQTDYKGLRPDLKRAVDAVTGQRGWQIPTNQKDYQKKLDTVGNIQTLMQQYRDLAQNYSSDSPGGGGSFLQRQQKGQLGGIVPVSPLNSKLDAMKATGGTLATFFDQQNRKSDAEILRQVTGSFDPKATVKENLDKLNTKQDLLNTTVRNTFAGFKPEQINYVLGNRKIVDFGGFKDSSSTKTGKPGNIKWITGPDGLPTEVTQ